MCHVKIRYNESQRKKRLSAMGAGVNLITRTILLYFILLGLHLTEDVKWDVHVKYVCNILNKNYFTINSLKNVISINALRGIYCANFHSHLRYGILF
jgi:hypothetical protein